MCHLWDCQPSQPLPNHHSEPSIPRAFLTLQAGQKGDYLLIHKEAKSLAHKAKDEISSTKVMRFTNKSNEAGAARLTRLSMAYIQLLKWTSPSCAVMTTHKNGIHYYFIGTKKTFGVNIQGNQKNDTCYDIIHISVLVLAIKQKERESFHKRKYAAATNSIAYSSVQEVHANERDAIHVLLCIS